MLDKDIHAQEQSFKHFLKYILGDEELWLLLNFIAKHNQIFIFSGIIRDFLTGIFDGIRDVDIVLQNTNHLDLVLKSLKNVEIRKNSFGGIKLKYKNFFFDVWELGNTWNIKRNNLKANPYILTNTVFFNFSAIVFDFQKEKFIYRKEFLDFLNTYKMDVICPDNPNEALCIVNTLYYREKYGFTISSNLSKWIKKRYCSIMDFHTVQQSHFGEVFFEDEEIEQFVKSL